MILKSVCDWNSGGGARSFTVMVTTSESVSTLSLAVKVRIGRSDRSGVQPDEIARSVAIVGKTRASRQV